MGKEADEARFVAALRSHKGKFTVPQLARMYKHKATYIYRLVEEYGVSVLTQEDLHWQGIAKRADRAERAEQIRRADRDERGRYKLRSSKLASGDNRDPRVRYKRRETLQQAKNALKLEVALAKQEGAPPFKPGPLEWDKKK